MDIEALDIKLIPFFGGLAVVIILGLGVEFFLSAFTDSVKKDENEEDYWVKISTAGKVIGMLESSLFYLSIIVGQTIFIGAWLAFKVAAKWETWSHIVRLPETELENLKSKSFEVRYSFGSWLYSRFLLGTLANIAIAVISAWIYLQIQKYCGAT